MTDIDLAESLNAIAETAKHRANSLNHTIDSLVTTDPAYQETVRRANRLKVWADTLEKFGDLIREDLGD